MPFTKHCVALNNYHNALVAIHAPSELQILVRDALNAITKDCRLFDTCITLDSPFFQEFFYFINLQDRKEIDDDICFTLFECLCIFFREKRLRFGIARLTPPEINILTYFEKSGHWDQNENTIIGNWYWHTLPQKVISDSYDRMK